MGLFYGTISIVMSSERTEIYIIDSQTVAVVEPQRLEGEDPNGHVVRPFTLKGLSSQDADAMPLDAAPYDLKDQILGFYNSVIKGPEDSHGI